MNIDDTIDNDVSAEDEAGELTPKQLAEQEQEQKEPPNERLAALNEISEQANANNRTHELSSDDDELDEDDEPLEADDESLLADEDEDESAIAPSDDLKELGYYRNTAGQLVTTMKINGQDREVLATDVKVHIQKDLAGEQKLQEASSRNQALDLRETDLSDRESRLQETLSPAKKASDMDPEEANAKAKDVLTKMWEGDEDAAVSALAEVIMDRGNASPDLEAVTQAAEKATLTTIEKSEQEKTQRAWNKSIDAGQKVFEAEYTEIYRDPVLFEAANAQTALMVEKRAAGDPEFVDLTPEQIIVRAAKMVKDKFGTDGSGLPTDAKSKQQREAAAERKGNLTKMPTKAKTARDTEEAEELDMSPAAVVGRMKNNRVVN